MANRSGYTDLVSMERLRKTVSGKVAIGAAGAPTLDALNSLGILSISLGTAGLYTVVFGCSQNGSNVFDVYRKFLCMAVMMQNATGVITTPSVGIKAIDVADPTKASITFQMMNNAGAATNPASGDTMWLEFELGDGS